MKKALLVFLIFILGSCQKKEAPKATIFAFNTSISITLYDGTKDDLYEVKEIFYRYNRLADYQNERLEVNVWYLNNWAYEREVEVNEEFWDLLLAAKDYYEITEGYFNPCIGQVSFQWKNILSNYQGENMTFEEEKLALKQNAILFENLVLDDYRVRYLKEDLKLDLGAVAKGYALGKVVKYLALNGVEKYMINAGTSSIAVGQETYNIHILDPLDQSKTFMTFKVNNNCVSTSADYQNYVLYNNEKFHHILNSKTLTVPHFYHSLTVIGEDAGMADALSTALFSMEYDEAIDILEKTGYEAVFYMYDGTIKMTDGVVVK